MTRSYRSVLIAAPVALALVLTGCSGSGDGELTYEDSPLSTYMAALYGGDMSPEEREEQWRVQQADMEELVAACMSDEGFEYVPQTDQGGGAVYSGDEWDPDSEEWVAQYGYGMIDWPGRDDDMSAVPDDDYQDPNQDYVNSLSESEQAAYWETLYGPGPSDEELDDEGSYEWDWETAGCYGAAQHETTGEDIWQSDEFAPLVERINQFYMTSQEAPELAELDTEWASCMADAGHAEFTRQLDAQESISTKLNELYESGDPETGEIDQAAMDALGEEEIALALVDLKCRDEVDYRQQQLAAQFELEERFIADNKAELDAFKAAAEQAN